MNIKRMRGRNHRSGGGGGGGGTQIRHHSGNIPLNRNHVFDSSGPDLRIRGTSQQLFEKYLQLGRDSSSSGDRVMAESYYQHAEHYFRILNAMAQANAQQTGQPHQPQANGNAQRRHNGDALPSEMEDDEPDPLVPQGSHPNGQGGHAHASAHAHANGGGGAGGEYDRSSSDREEPGES